MAHASQVRNNSTDSILNTDTAAPADTIGQAQTRVTLLRKHRRGHIRVSEDADAAHADAYSHADAHARATCARACACASTCPCVYTFAEVPLLFLCCTRSCACLGTPFAAALVLARMSALVPIPICTSIVCGTPATSVHMRTRTWIRVRICLSARVCQAASRPVAAMVCMRRLRAPVAPRRLRPHCQLPAWRSASVDRPTSVMRATPNRCGSRHACAADRAVSRSRRGSEPVPHTPLISIFPSPCSSHAAMRVVPRFADELTNDDDTQP